ncbi:pyridoxal-phosphate-dependent aminotransferase family protein [Oceanobacillus manasiensis]|uniref:pyridoxal-phosphate-dependent aminotransferase family protein n=1 Tax=Oceanobacillus manasiensis TaxID=586413 RepID=UPI0005A60C0E|nr:alanine--glyoxylate aminotransferase family protein [Oceanobacillus manasiensis]
MLADQQFLRIPGPSPIPPSVHLAMGNTMIGHRDVEAKSLIEQLRPRLKPIFGTKEEVLILTGSGTAALEMAVVNAVEPGDEVLILVTGSFGDRFAKICQAYGINVHRLDMAWGEAIDTRIVETYLQQNPTLKAVFATYCETSTGVLNPVKELANVVRHHSEALFIVDGVSCVGAVPVQMDNWGIDILVTGSQKAFMLPAGLAFAAASARAWKRIEENNTPRFYLDMKKYRDNINNNTTPFTPALSLLFGLKQVLQLLEKEGLENVFARHKLMMQMTRSAFKAHHINLLTTDESASPTVTAVKPTDFQVEELRKTLKNEFHLSIAGGQQQLKGKIFRIGHMGYCSPADVLQTISIIEMALIRIGKPLELGKGVEAAQKTYLS